MKCCHPKVLKSRLVSCGECYNCRKKRVNDWAVRLELESKLYKGKSLFITLTYNDCSLPSDELLHKEEYQKFLKRLRINAKRQYGIENLKYFLSGEYGSQYGRPHFHLILFGLPYSTASYNLILKSWNKGFIDVKLFNFRNAKYVAKYCVKNFGKEKKHLKINSITGEFEEVVSREFVSMSRKTGLGFSYYNNDSKIKELLEQGFINIGKFKYGIPKAFIRKWKEQGIERPPQKLVIFYNENVEESKKIVNDIVFLKNYFKTEYYIDFDVNTAEIKSFEDLFNEIEGNCQSAKNKTKSFGIDINDYYFKQMNFKYFDLLKSKYFEYSGQKNIDKYFHFMRDFFYKNFGLLFY